MRGLSARTLHLLKLRLPTDTCLRLRRSVVAHSLPSVCRSTVSTNPRLRLVLRPQRPRTSSLYLPRRATNMSGDKQAIKKILQTEPELLYQADNQGNHPLHYAGASVNALNDRQQTPLLISVISNDDDDDKVARILLFHHAKPMIKVTDDLMLAQYASSRGLHKIAAAIREYM
ncbi:hypothetical protein JG688_00006315 [Phytophthora aleatoria]|uniref:Uncharacterized protein n=1 Tax=Phytophthora aleatoria TaxID=2496075 RepID=A0A8J5MGR2_9STRA|nr:hypothetical protein JG688_00006315 [Phytophthora aleatoria]